MTQAELMFSDAELHAVIKWPPGDLGGSGGLPV